MKLLGIISALAMPFFNIPLIIHMWQRKSSEDISLIWAVGAWVCVVGMLPSSLLSSDVVLRIFGIVNSIFFTGVFLSVIHFRRPR